MRCPKCRVLLNCQRCPKCHQKFKSTVEARGLSRPRRKNMPTVKEIIRGLYNIDEDSAAGWIAQGLNSLTPEMLAQAIDEWQDPLLLVEYLNLESPVVKPLAIFFVLKPFWERIEQTMKDQNGLYSELSADPVKKKMLDTPRGKAWLRYVGERCFEYLRYYTWSRECPLCTSEMERKKVSSYDAYICGHCKYTIKAVVSDPPESTEQKPPQIPGFSQHGQ